MAKAPTHDTYHHGNLKAALVRAGLAMLEEAGLERLSLRGIAARVGVSHTAPKNHFGGLGGLLSAIAAEGYRRHKIAMTEGLRQDATRQDRLHAAANGYVRFAQENPELFRLMFSPARLDFEAHGLGEAARASYAVLEGVSEGLAWTPLDGAPVTEGRTEVMLWSAVHGYAHLLISGEVGLGPQAGTPPATAVIPWLDYRSGKTRD
ncbi:MAG: TetR-like C-terminal domain-containing protein [Pseudomonadota bacterium]